jgi:hypothetical protein
MKKIIFNRKTIDCELIEVDVFTENTPCEKKQCYYYFDKKGNYKHIEKSRENRDYVIDLNYKRYSA